MHVNYCLKRVVVTGLGPVTPVGIGKEPFWENVIHGKSSFKRIEFPNRDMAQYRCQIAAPIEGFDIYQFIDRTKHSRHLGKTSQYAIAATRLALMDAGLTLGKNEETREGSSPSRGTGSDQRVGSLSDRGDFGGRGRGDGTYGELP